MCGCGCFFFSYKCTDSVYGSPWGVVISVVFMWCFFPLLVLRCGLPSFLISPRLAAHRVGRPWRGWHRSRGRCSRFGAEASPLCISHDHVGSWPSELGLAWSWPTHEAFPLHGASTLATRCSAASCFPSVPINVWKFFSRVISRRHVWYISENCLLCLQWEFPGSFNIMPEKKKHGYIFDKASWYKTFFSTLFLVESDCDVWA